MATACTGSVVVWEWETDNHSTFVPYNADSSNLIEQENNSGHHLVDLSVVDAFHAAWKVDLTRSKQIALHGKERDIQRKVYSSSYPISSGIVWEWKRCCIWEQFSVKHVKRIEDSYNKGAEKFNFKGTKLKVPYAINFSEMSQSNKLISFTDIFRRRQLVVGYVSEPSQPKSFRKFTGKYGKTLTKRIVWQDVTGDSDTESDDGSDDDDDDDGNYKTGRNYNNHEACHAGDASSGKNSKLHHTRIGRPGWGKSKLLSKNYDIEDSDGAETATCGTDKSAVIVWEWETNIPGVFAPYQEEASNFLETENKAGRNKVNLSSIDQFHAALTVNFSTMKQISSYFGKQRQLRRMLYGKESCIGNGVVWEWMSDLGWQQYLADISEIIENSFKYGENEVDLEPTAQKMSSRIIFNKLIQIDKMTGETAAVRRRLLKVPFVSCDIQKSSKYRARKPATAAKGFGTSNSKEDDEPLLKHLRKRPIKHKALLNFCLPCGSVEEHSDCSICLEKLTEHSSSFGADSDHSVIELKQCHHKFHECCLEACYESGNKDGSLQCPVCKTIHGIKCGIQPPGNMTVTRMPRSVPGYDGHGCIQITYNIQSGIQGPNHPSPGSRFAASGFPRIAYLPDNQKGNKVLRLLQTAWNRSLIFTIATSVTTGAHNSVVWNEIHHKTEGFSNHSGHGYPDPNYLDNVLQELKSQGVE